MTAVCVGGSFGIAAWDTLVVCLCIHVILYRLFSVRCLFKHAEYSFIFLYLFYRNDRTS